MKLRKYAQIQLGILLGLLVSWPMCVQANLGFVAQQSDCKINCLNGGVCAFDIGNPDIHKCICFIGLFEGERCEFKVTTTQAPNSAVTTDGDDGQIYEEDFHEAAPDLHYTEFNGRGADDLQKVDNALPSDEPTAFNNQGDDYAEFEPHHNNELYHEAVIAPTDVTPVSTETQTIQEQTTQSNDNQMDKQDNLQPEQDDDEFYEDDSSWMMYKKRSANGASFPSFTTSFVGILAIRVFWL